eukprot:1158973-Pelagomonas_calceolata.AAC.11
MDAPFWQCYGCFFSAIHAARTATVTQRAQCHSGLRWMLQIHPAQIAIPQAESQLSAANRFLDACPGNSNSAEYAQRPLSAAHQHPHSFMAKITAKRARALHPGAVCAAYTSSCTPTSRPLCNRFLKKYAPALHCGAACPVPTHSWLRCAL